MKKAPEIYKIEAIKLRKNGLSYGEIKRKIPISKSTLSLWLKDTPLKKKDKKRLYTKRIYNLSLGPNSQKERRKREIDEIIKISKNEIEIPISMEAYRLYGAALYWGEGTKDRGLVITNSDPSLVLFMVKWFETIFKINPKTLKAYLNIYSQQNESDLKKFWSDLCKIPIENFGKSFIKPGNKSYKKNNLYYGTIKIHVPKSTDMRIKVFGWIQKTLESINADIEKVQKKWGHLKKVTRSANLY
jgi:hypothetical protein